MTLYPGKIVLVAWAIMTVVALVIAGTAHAA
jgi:hypothetical protein